MTDWESLYRTYRKLEDTWAQGGEHSAVAEDEARAYRNQQVRLRVFAAAEGIAQLHRPTSIDAAVWDELSDLNRQFNSLSYDAYRRGADGTAEGPCDDVYHAAVSMLMQLDRYKTDSGRVYYRGQNFPWSLIPGAIRGRSEAMVVAAIERVRQFAVAFRQEFAIRMTDEQVASVAQHYIGETWYLDFSANPFIALFFATDPPCSEHCGVVHTLTVSEWDDWSGAGTNELGALERITVAEALRISNQDWSSLRTPHPILMSIAFPRSLYFRQVEGVVFRDAERLPPITDAHIYPPSSEDPYRAFAERWKAGLVNAQGSRGTAPALSGEPDLTVLSLSTHELLARLARGRLAQLRAQDPGRYLRTSVLDEEVDKSVERLAEIWASRVDNPTPQSKIATLGLFHFMCNIRSLAGGNSLADCIRVGWTL